MGNSHAANDRRLKLGVAFPYAVDLVVTKSFVQELAAILEEGGVESVWTSEHVVVSEDYESINPHSPDGRMAVPTTVAIPDPLELLSFIAACTSTIQLGTSLIIAPLHSAAVLAKRAATVDRLSGGRLLLGLGIGWQKEEFAAVGIPFSDRGGRMDECIEVLRTLWRDASATYSGRYVAFEHVHSFPRPAAGRVPIVLGGHTPPAIRRAGRLADGWFPHAITPPEFEAAVEALRGAAAAAGRDLTAIEISARPGSRPGFHDPIAESDVATVRSYVAAGASRIVIQSGITDATDLSRLPNRLRRYREDVLDRL